MVWPLKKDKDLGYGICLNSCDCEVIENEKKFCKVNEGMIVKLFKFNKNTSDGLTILNDRRKLHMAKSLSVDPIASELFKYLNAINNCKERLEFYRNSERLQFVLRLKKHSVVGVGFSNEIQTKAVFLELNESEKTIFITVELSEKPSTLITEDLKKISNGDFTNNCKYSLPASMIRTFAFNDIHQKNHENLQNEKFSTSNVSINKSISVGIDPLKTTPHKNKTLGTSSYNEASNDEAKNDFTVETVERRTKYFEKLSKTAPINSAVSVPGSNVSESNIVTMDTILSTETRNDINNCMTNENDLSDTSNLAVIHNTSASNCIICKKDFDISEGFFFDLCKHTICKICIKYQTALKKLAHINIMPCCNRPIELDEKKYFSDIQQCFDKNCAYYLWEECSEERLNTFTCIKCDLENCLKCRTIHVNLTCGQYDKINGEDNFVDKETVEMLLTMIRKGLAMPCPNCEALIEKDEGCDWVQCLFCNIEICWATRGPRWGPNGNGDTSGGCGCDFKVKKCVENCNYCH